MRVAFLLSLLLLAPATAGCIVPKDMPALREELGYASVDQPDFQVHVRADTLEPAVNEALALEADVEGIASDRVDVSWTIDGQAREGATTTVTFTTPGPKPVNVTAEGPNGSVARDAVTLDVRENQPPAPAIEVPDRENLRADRTVTFSANATTDPDGDALTYAWTIDGDEAGTGSWVQTDLEPGLHEVSVTVDDGLATATASEAFAVNEFVRETRNLSAQDNVTRLNVNARPGLAEIDVTLTHTTRLGADDVNLVLASPEGEPLARSAASPEPGASTATESITLAGDRLEPGPYTVAAQLDRGISATVTIEGVFTYTPLDATPK